MKLSILLRTQNAGKELSRFAPRVAEGCEIVLVDHGSSDETRAIAADMGATVCDYPARAFSYGAAINLGVAACTGDWVLVASPHFVPLTDDFWNRLDRSLRELPADVLAYQGKGIINLRHARRVGGLAILDYSDLADLPDKIYGNSCCAYRRAALAAFPFDESLKTAEDAEWYLRVIRAGRRVAVDHGLVYLYRNRAPLSRYWRRGRDDYPAMEKIFGRSFTPSPMHTLIRFLKDIAVMLMGDIPVWLWIRLVVRRGAELSLVLMPRNPAPSARNRPESGFPR